MAGTQYQVSPNNSTQTTNSFVDSTDCRVLRDEPRQPTDDLTVRVRVTPLSSPLVVKRIEQAKADAPRETPRGKRERIARHYSKALSMALSALYDGQAKFFPGRDYIEYVISALGYDNPDQWAYITDADLILSNMVAVQMREDVLLAREMERIGKQRVKLNEWQAKDDSPIIIEFEAEYDSENKVNRSRYKRPICELVREIVSECPVGTPDKRLRVVVARKAAEYLQRFQGAAKTVKGKRQHSADSDAGRAATFALGAYRKQEEKSGEADAELLIRNAFKAKFGPELYARIFAENEKFSVANIEVNPESCGKPVGAESGAEIGGLYRDKNLIPTAQSPGETGAISSPESLINLEVDKPKAVKPLVVGQSMADFLSENFPEDLAHGDQAATRPGSWRDKAVTQDQRDLLLKAGEFNIPATRGAASDRITELLDAGALSPFFSLAELEQFDPKAGGASRKERRFCCPDCGVSKPMDDDHRSLSLNTSTGAYHCHRCEAAGVAREYLGDAGAARTFIHTGPAKLEPKSEKWREWVTKAQAISDSAGAKYLEGRGVPVEVAEAAGVKFGPWWKGGEVGPVQFPAVIFSAFDQAGNLVAAQARAIIGDTKRTGGDKQEGVFLSNPDALNANQIAIVEAPIDALILEACGVRTIATLGKSWPTWLSGALEGKDVAMAQDADKDGDECAAGLASLLRDRATTWRLRPVGAKDWAELAERDGLDAVVEQVIAAMEYAPEVVR